MEFLSRAPVAVRQSSSAVYVGWRMLGTDPASIGFNVYRNGVKLNAAPITNSTNYVDNVTTNGSYTIRPVVNGTEQAPTNAVNVWTNNYRTIPLQIPPGGTTPSGEAYTYTANDASVGDLDGDGEYEIILKWDPTNAKDNSQSGYTGNVYLDAYKLNGTRLWRIDLGRNIRAGAHYTQHMVYDLDGDGKAEVAVKTADGTIDGVGTVIGNASADYRNSGGYILSGPEFLTIFNGQTGAAMATTNYLPARGTVSSWGDNYGNRVDRFVNAVAYLDGARPSLIMGRGYYTRLVRVAWDWRNGQLTQRWTFDSNTSGNGGHAGQGNHQVTVGDVDNDGKQELINGSSAINDNGTSLYVNGLGHGDAMHMTDLDPERPGQELWQSHESPSQYGNFGIEFRDARTGTPIWGRGAANGINGDIGRAMAADIDPTHLGYEVWASAGELYTCKGTSIGTAKPSMNFGIWWDGDLCRELLDGVKLDKWNYTAKNMTRLLTLSDYGAASNNGTKANPALTADLLGDWREEILLRSSDNSNLLLFTTTIPTSHRLYTLMHNAQYRTAVAWQNTAYNQPPYPDYYLGTGMATPPQPNIYIPNSPALPVSIAEKSVTPVKALTIRPNPADNAAYIDYNSNNTRLIVVITATDGRVVFRRTGSITELNNGLNAVIGGFVKGVYIVQLKDGEQQSSGKLVIN
nr:T9SS type A sorting domain-containing protein [Chitinophaga rhizophila]